MYVNLLYNNLYIYIVVPLPFWQKNFLQQWSTSSHDDRDDSDNNNTLDDLSSEILTDYDFDDDWT